MDLNRRNWLRLTGLLAAGAGMSTTRAIAAPLVEYAGSVQDKSGIRLSSNENPYGPSPLAKTAMREAVGISNRYQWKMIRQLMEAIAARHNTSADNVLVGAGSTQIIDAVIQLAVAQKGTLVLAAPTFSRWTNAAEKCGLKKIAVPLNADKKHDLPNMLTAIREDTRLVYVCNPNNPTGTVCRHEDLQAFIKEATKKTLVLVDEAYIDYSNQPSVSSLISDNKNLIVVRTFSKIYGLAGARIGYALGYAATIDKLGELQSGANISISAVSMAGALASLKDTAFVTDTARANDKARANTIQQLEALNITCIPSHTNFIYFSLAGYRKDFFALLKAHRIEGTEIFEEDGKWSRITVGTNDEMEKFIAAVKG